MDTELTTTLVVMTTDGDDDPGEDSHVITALRLIECVILIIGLFGNTMLFILMRSKKMSRHSFSVYFCFAAIFDTLNIFWNCLQDTYDLFHDNGVEQDAFRSYTFGCGMLEEMDGWFPITSAWLMVLLCIDRYISICHPTAAQTFYRRPVALFACVLTVLCSFVFGLPLSLIIPDKSDNDPSNGPVLCGYEASDNLDGLDVTEQFITFFIPVVVVVVLNTLILVRLNKKNAFRDEDSLTEHGNQQNKINRLNVSIFYLLVITALTWLPYAVVNMLETVNSVYDDDTTEASVRFDYAWHATLDLWLFTFAQNFYVLMVMSPVYRKEMRRQCACLPWCRSVEHERFDLDGGFRSGSEQIVNDVKL